MNRIIFALDVYDYNEALNLSKELSNDVFAIKVNWPLVMNNGISIVKEISRYSNVICDFKIADIDNTNRLITEKARENNAWGIITHSFTGRRSLKAVVSAAGDMKVFSLVSMSQESFIDNYTDDLIKMSMEENVYGLVAPGNRIDILRHIRSMSGDLKIIAPGIGAQGGSITDAIMAGADYVIIGRSIYSDPEPLKKVKSLNEILGDD
ncbi:orotidine-5'-phosphate decarboxylase [Picrophilus oshimae]|uniref:Orotidine 5'-phosphate decarboxylase n=1 Tax=Picrophilus torridus (strain ATCC 700027 / DSM 9790 / JCM 10055 / NBRC 100828 / KAW 2/3) TaxID=1122961 RepID=Q6L2K7_PICTO|nr:orotidine-5'-phosphate decarboxylase [Picrophilus oshimae]AAT42795.1 orotidine 5'-phosphate decarboxylase [Picrophilus oshimae DSM 9789]